MVITGVQFYHGSETPSAGEGATLAGDESRTIDAQPQRGLAAQASGRGQAMPVGMPLFSPVSLNEPAGLMPVGLSVESPLFLTPSPHQSRNTDQAQASLLQSYLDRHAEGATYRSGDVWMPLLRASGHEAPEQR